jgi:hypothetical protein
VTIVIGLHQDDYALIASDTRVVWMDDDVIVHRDDNSLKVHKIGNGLISGSGDSWLLNRVEARLDATDINHTDEILAIIREERERFKQEARYRKDYIQKSLDTTGWMFSYETPQEDGPELRLALVHPSFGFDCLGLIPPGTCKIVFPTDHVDYSLQERLKKEIRPIKTPDQLVEAVISQLHAIQDVIGQVSTKSRYVSPLHTIGIHILGSDKMIFTECSRPES